MYDGGAGRTAVAVLVALAFFSGAAAGVSVSTDLVDTLDRVVDESSDQADDLVWDSGPDLRLDSPFPGERVCGSVQIEGYVDGTDVVPTTVVEIRDRSDGSVVEGPVEVSIDGETFSYTTDLDAGKYTVGAAVSDADGQATEESHDFQVRPPLTLGVTSPRDGRERMQVDRIDGSVRSCVGDVGSVDVRVEDADGALAVDPQAELETNWNGWSAPVSTDLAPGDYRAIAEAVDTEGNTKTVQTAFTIVEDLQEIQDAFSDPTSTFTYIHVTDVYPQQTLRSLGEVCGSLSASAGQSATLDAAVLDGDGATVAEESATAEVSSYGHADWCVDFSDQDLAPGAYVLSVHVKLDVGPLERTIPFTVTDSDLGSIRQCASGEILEAGSCVSLQDAFPSIPLSDDTCSTVTGDELDCPDLGSGNGSDPDDSGDSTGGSGGDDPEDGSTPGSNPSQDDDPNGTDQPGDGSGDEPDGGNGADDASTDGSPSDFSSAFPGGDALGDFLSGAMPWWIYVGVFAATVAVGGGVGWWRRSPSGGSPETPEVPLDAFHEDDEDG